MSSRIIAGIYKHYKNQKLYNVAGCVLHTETQEHMVLYASLNPKPNEIPFVRPIEQFVERVEWNGKTVPRFEYVCKRS